MKLIFLALLSFGALGECRYLGMRPRQASIPITAPRPAGWAPRSLHPARWAPGSPRLGALAHSACSRGGTPEWGRVPPTCLGRSQSQHA